MSRKNQPHRVKARRMTALRYLETHIDGARDYANKCAKAQRVFAETNEKQRNKLLRAEYGEEGVNDKKFFVPHHERWLAKEALHAARNFLRMEREIEVLRERTR